MFRVLDPIDQVIHAIINLGRCGEFQRGFRDTWDLCCLVEGSDPLTEAASSSFNWDEFTRRVASLRLGKIAAYILALTVEFHSADVPESVIEGLGGVSRQRLSRTTLYRTMRTAALPSDWHFYSRNRRIAMRAMLHYPLPRVKTWLDPLTWTKRISFLRDA